MAKIEGKNEWSDVVLIENGDVLSGGVDGKVNEQSIALVNRTNWIKENTKKTVTKINGKEAVGNEVNLTIADIGAAALDHTHDEEYMKLLEVTANDVGKVVRAKMDGSGFELSVVSELPIGSIIAFAGKAVPFGFLECDGRVLSRDAYTQLYEAIGTIWGSTSDIDFRLPNLTEDERFLRSRSTTLPIGTLQGDAIRKFIARFGFTKGVEGPWASDALSLTFNGNNTYSGHSGPTLNSNLTFELDPSKVVPTADENRPKSAVVMYCIKVLDSVRDPEQILAQEAIADVAHRNEIKELAGTRLWVSGEYQPILNMSTVVSHGLNIDPLRCRCDVLLKCVGAEGGYAVGDYAIGWSGLSMSGNHVSHPPIPSLTSSTIQYNTGAYSLGITAYNKTNGSIVAGLKLANWRYIFRIWY